MLSSARAMKQGVGGIKTLARRLQYPYKSEDDIRSLLSTPPFSLAFLRCHGGGAYSRTHTCADTQTRRNRFRHIYSVTSECVSASHWLRGASAFFLRVACVCVCRGGVECESRYSSGSKMHVIERKIRKKICRHKTCGKEERRAKQTSESQRAVIIHNALECFIL